MPDAHPSVLTIGHSNHSLEGFMALLSGAGVTAIADVRSSPSSRHCSQFDREPLRASLHAAGIEYVFLGHSLGGRPADPSLFTDGVADYERMAKTREFRRGIERVMDGAGRYRVALLCSERDPLDCHRFLMVSRALDERGCAVAHILADGTVETMDETEQRLLDLTGVQQVDLFGRSQADLLDAAYRKRARVVAYRRREA
jgi:uncharacterized protein (DUF488 family)